MRGTGGFFLDKKFTTFVSRSHVEERVEVTGCLEQLDTCDPESGRLRMSVPWSGFKVMTKIHPPLSHPLRAEAKTTSINMVIFTQRQPNRGQKVQRVHGTESSGLSGKARLHIILDKTRRRGRKTAVLRSKGRTPSRTRTPLIETRL